MQHIARLRIVAFFTVLVALIAALGASWVRAKKPGHAPLASRKHHAKGKRAKEPRGG